jgi:hypothetical protein
MSEVAALQVEVRHVVRTVSDLSDRLGTAFSELSERVRDEGIANRELHAALADRVTSLERRSEVEAARREAYEAGAKDAYSRMGVDDPTDHGPLRQAPPPRIHAPPPPPIAEPAPPLVLPPDPGTTLPRLLARIQAIPVAQVAGAIVTMVTLGVAVCTGLAGVMQMTTSPAQPVDRAAESSP